MPHPRYIDFDRDAWSKLRANTPLTLDETDLEKLRGINVALDLEEVQDMYLPLSRLLNLEVQGSRQMAAVTDTFLGTPPRPIPFIVGVAGSVAVGKSTISRVMQALLSRWPDHPEVELVTTDGFLYPNSILEERGLMEKKGFPQSYDRRALLSFVARAKAGEPHIEVPVYSHIKYDVVDGESRVIDHPDILIVEGLNVLQAGGGGAFVSDYFDFTIFVDADPSHIKEWYVERFLTLKDTAFAQPDAYFRRFSELTDDEAVEVAGDIWTRINEANLYENILPTRDRASLILEKDHNHALHRVRLRR